MHAGLEGAAAVVGVFTGLLILVGFASYQMRQFRRVYGFIAATS
jgi:hypothetical protein